MFPMTRKKTVHITNPAFSKGKIPRALGQSPRVLPRQISAGRQIVASKSVVITSGRKSIS
jgi:hypothetical protein